MVQPSRGAGCLIFHDPYNGRTMTDDEIKKLYRRVIGPIPRADEKYAKGWLDNARKAIEARSLRAAVAILTREDWGEPLIAAKALRSGKKAR